MAPPPIEGGAVPSPPTGAFIPVVHWQVSRAPTVASGSVPQLLRLFPGLNPGPQSSLLLSSKGVQSHPQKTVHFATDLCVGKSRLGLSRSETHSFAVRVVQFEPLRYWCQPRGRNGLCGGRVFQRWFRAGLGSASVSQCNYLCS